jgi:hypothetical protein
LDLIQYLGVSLNATIRKLFCFRLQALKALPFYERVIRIRFPNPKPEAGNRTVPERLRSKKNRMTSDE